RLDLLSGNPAPGSRASAVNSTTDVSANGRFVTSTRWNTHYLVPKKNTGPGADDSIPIDAFTAATPDWVFVTNQGATTITSPSNFFPDTNFAANFQSDATRAAAYFTSIINNASGFLSTNSTTWAVNSNALRTDQSFVNRQELLAFRGSTQFSSNALQYLGTSSRGTNSPSFSPSTPAGGTVDYAALASTSTAVNPNFLLRTVSTSFTRFD